MKQSRRLLNTPRFAISDDAYFFYSRFQVGTSNTLDVFYTNPVNRIAATGGTNEWDSSNNNQSFYGAYLSNQSLGSDYGVTALETYYIGYDNTVQNFSFHTL
jgi:hypothetical protein